MERWARPALAKIDVQKVSLGEYNHISTFPFFSEVPTMRCTDSATQYSNRLISRSLLSREKDRRLERTELLRFVLFPHFVAERCVDEARSLRRVIQYCSTSPASYRTSGSPLRETSPTPIAFRSWIISTFVQLSYTPATLLIVCCDTAIARLRRETRSVHHRRPQTISLGLQRRSNVAVPQAHHLRAQSLSQDSWSVRERRGALSKAVRRGDGSMLRE